MGEASTGGVVAEVLGWITIWSILTYFWLTSVWLITLTVFLWVDILFWLLDSYIVTKDTSSIKLVEWLARKATRRALPFILIAALRWVWYDWIEMMANVVMSVLIISEWYSIIWHIYAINYNEKLPEIDALKLLIQEIWKLFRSKLTNEWEDKKQRSWNKLN